MTPDAINPPESDDRPIMAEMDTKTRVKRLAVSVWNALYHRAALVWGYLNAVVHGRFEHCSVCGRFGPMIYRRGVICDRLTELWGLSPRLAESFARKESCICTHCGASLRVRRLAQALLATYRVASAARAMRSLAQWAAQPEIRALRIAEINMIPGLHETLAPLPGFAPSDYRPDIPAGTVVDGLRSEDLMNLTYADGSFDLVVTSETLEHVPDLDRALGEIHRVLVPGGRHIFTIPVLPTVTTSFRRSTISPDGSVQHHAPRICHPGGDVGYPVFTEFGADIGELLGRAGFDLEVLYGPNRENNVAQVYDSRKRLQQ